MTWFRHNLRVLVTVGIFLVSGLVGIRSELLAAIDKKADAAAVTREMDQIHGQLKCINDKLDALLLQRNNP